MKEELLERVGEAMSKGSLKEVSGVATENASWETHIQGPEKLGRSSGPWAAGQVAGLITGVLPVRDLVEQMVREANAILSDAYRMP